MIDFESFFKEKMKNIMTMAWAEKSEMFDTVDDDEKLRETIFTSGQNREMRI